tara:strand:- start:10998 stop:11234 length:237 start_codon:yes stop_codon:yes gene_type:complete
LRELKSATDGNDRSNKKILSGRKIIRKAEANRTSGWLQSVRSEGSSDSRNQRQTIEIHEENNVSWQHPKKLSSTGMKL